MAEEIIHVIPLRKEWLKVPRWKRTKKAIRAVREYLIKHMKSENVKIGRYLNEYIWERGMRKPPGKIKVRVSKDGEVIRAELFDAPVEKKEEEKKKVVGEEKKRVEKEEKKEKFLEKVSSKEEIEEEKKKKKPEVSEQEKTLKKTERKIKEAKKVMGKEASQKFRFQKMISDSGKK